MSKMKFVVMFVLLAFAVNARADCGMTDVGAYLVNKDFELPGDGKITGFDMDDGAYYNETFLPAEIPGWESDGFIINSGVETPWITSPGGTWGWDPPGDTTWAGWSAYLMNGDPGIYQTSSRKMNEGETYFLTYYMGPTGNNGGAPFIGMAAFYALEGDGSKTILATDVHDYTIEAPPGGWWNPTAFYWTKYCKGLLYTATASDAGKYIGVFVDNIGTDYTESGVNDSWIGFDIPEPATLILLGLGSLSLLRRKR